MRVLIIPDKFKGSLTAQEVIAAIEDGIRKADPQISTEAITASDGGDGFLDSIKQSQPDAEAIVASVSDPLQRPIEASYLRNGGANTAFVEMARASGMELLTSQERNPLCTTTFGTGQLIADAVSRGAEKIYVGLGGSATNDGAVGIATALGYRFVDESGMTVQPVGGQLSSIAAIQRLPELKRMDNVRLFAINDVQNPLLGQSGAAKVYGPQKGADETMVAQLEQGLDHLQQIVKRDLNRDAASIPGSGAAGGTGYGLKAFFDAEFLSGVEFVLSLAGVETLLSSGSVDLIITGEGCIDDQTAYGKLVRGVAQVGAKHGVQVAAICGALRLQSKSVEDLGLEKVIAIHQPQQTLDYTMQNAGMLVRKAAEQLIASLPAAR